MKPETTSLPALSKDLQELKRDVKNLKDSNLRTELKVNDLAQSFGEVKREILFFKEEILGEIKETREEFSIALNQYTRREDVLDNHSKRLSKLEVKVFARSSK